MKMTGAQILLKCLEREEVKHIFGYPGGVVLDIYDELTRTRTSSTSWCATSRARSTPPTAMPGPPARWGCAW